MLVWSVELISESYLLAVNCQLGDLGTGFLRSRLGFVPAVLLGD